MALKSVCISKAWFLVAPLLALGIAGCELLNKAPHPAPAVSETAQSDPSGYSSENARRAKANSELLREVYFVVFGQEPKNRSEFGDMLDSMNQGASLEGVYNGLTHSAAYRKIESENQGATPTAVRVFAEELALLTLELKEPTEFSEDAAKPLAVAVTPSAEGPSAVFKGKKPAEKPDAAMLAAKFERLFSKASIFTLKRVLGDEALRVATEKKVNLPELASWYGKWVVRVVARGVDFGIPQRNLADESFHTQWAVKATEDQLRWEILNRLHRLLNEMQRRK